MVLGFLHLPEKKNKHPTSGITERSDVSPLHAEKGATRSPSRRSSSQPSEARSSCHPPRAPPRAVRHGRLSKRRARLRCLRGVQGLGFSERGRAQGGLGVSRRFCRSGRSEYGSFTGMFHVSTTWGEDHLLYGQLCSWR